MRVFVDVNVIVSVLNKEYPLFTNSARILSSNNKKGVQLFTSPLCLAIAFYFSSKKSGEKLAKKKIALLSENMGITTINENVTKQAVNNPNIHDFEDGIQYYSALEKNCKTIITEDKNDYYFSEIETLNCEEFIMKYLK